MPENDSTNQPQDLNAAEATRTLKITVSESVADLLLKQIGGKFPEASELDEIHLVITR
jgi:hypothetical protein